MIFPRQLVPVRRISAPEPASCNGLALRFGATPVERYGRVFWALTVSKTNY